LVVTCEVFGSLSLFAEWEAIRKAGVLTHYPDLVKQSTYERPMAEITVAEGQDEMSS